MCIRCCIRTLSKINFLINDYRLAIIVEPPIPEHEDQSLYENENIAKLDMSEESRTEYEEEEVAVAVEEQTVEETLETVSYSVCLFLYIFTFHAYGEGHVD